MNLATVLALATLGLCPPRQWAVAIKTVNFWSQTNIASIRTYVEFLWRDVNKRREVSLSRLYGEEFLHAA